MTEVTMEQCVTCPGCAFAYGALHTDADGNYTCPLCALSALREVADAAKEYVAAVSACALDQSLPLCHVDAAFDAQVDALARLEALSSLRSEGSPDKEEEKDGQ